MLQKEDIQQIRMVVKEEVSSAILENNKHLVTKDDLIENNKNLVTKDDLIENNKNLVTKDDLIENNKNLVTKDDLIENNKNLVTKDDLIENNKQLATKNELHELILMVQKGFDIMETRFQDLEYQISLRPTMAKIMDWSDRRIHALEMGLQKTKYILKEEWEKLPPQREIHRSLMNRGLIE